MTHTDATPWLPARRTLPALTRAVQDCQGCDLFAEATQAVMGRGPRDAALMLVGEQPGDREDLEGRPFVGPAGRLLDGALREAGLDPAGVFLTNAVKHFRFDWQGKRRIHESPSRWHVASCTPWLLAELDLVRPQGIVLLGATAGSAVYGGSFRVGVSRGKFLDWPAEPVLTKPPAWLLATAHPSAVLRSRHREDDLALLVADLRMAADALD